MRIYFDHNATTPVDVIMPLAAWPSRRTSCVVMEMPSSTRNVPTADVASSLSIEERNIMPAFCFLKGTRR